MKIKAFLISFVAILLLIIFLSKTKFSQASRQLQQDLAFAPENLVQITEGWKTQTNKRSDITFTLKYPQGWIKPFDYCDTSVVLQGYSIPSNCIKTVIFTRDFPDDSLSSIGRDLTLVSETKTEIDGYQSIRKVYAITDDTLKTPDTYHLWIYKNSKPYALVVTWIGYGTSDQKARELIQTIDTMMHTLKFQKNE